MTLQIRHLHVFAIGRIRRYCIITVYLHLYAPMKSKF